MDMLSLNLFDCRIKNVKGHFEIYDKYGKFVVSGATENEALECFKDILVEWVRQRESVCASV